MGKSHDSGGFTIIEVLVVTTIIIAIIAISSSYLSGKFAFRRSVDDVTNQIASMLQLGRLRSLREGVGYRLVLADCTNINESDPDCKKCNSDASYEQYQEGDDELTLILERGDSNLGRPHGAFSRYIPSDSSPISI
jgi:type II secretory pathway pseudopilin PulG